MLGQLAICVHSFRRLALAPVIGLFVLSPAALGAETLILRNLMLLDGMGTPVRPIAQMVIADGRIEAMNNTILDVEPAEPGDQVTVIDLSGFYVMPGLIDAHVHLANFPRGHETLSRQLEWAVRGGVTTVRDMGGDARVLAEARRAIQAGELLGPNLRISAIMGAPTLFNHYALQAAAQGFGPGQAPWLRSIVEGQELAGPLAEARGAGVDALKIYGDLDSALVQALATEARRQHLMVWAHATVFPARPSELLDAGVQTLSHAPYLIWEAVENVPADYRARTDAPYTDYPPDHPQILALLDRMAEESVVLDATLAMFRDMTKYRPAEGIEWAMQAFEWGVAVTRLAHERGVPIAVGTDAFFPPSEHALPNTHIELQTLVNDVGMQPQDAIVAATRNGALAAGVSAERGTLAPGMAADLIVIERDPTVDINATREIHQVVINGQLLR